MATFSLAKHPYERRILMCWYKIKISKFTIEFRSDAFVTEEEEYRLHDIHCNYSTNKDLLDRCSLILEPYKDQIIKEAEQYLSLSCVDRMKIKKFSLK